MAEKWRGKAFLGAITPYFDYGITPGRGRGSPSATTFYGVNNRRVAAGLGVARLQAGSRNVLWSQLGPTGEKIDIANPFDQLLYFLTTNIQFDRSKKGFFSDPTLNRSLGGYNWQNVQLSLRTIELSTVMLVRQWFGLAI